MESHPVGSVWFIRAVAWFRIEPQTASLDWLVCKSPYRKASAVPAAVISTRMDDGRQL